MLDTESKREGERGRERERKTERETERDRERRERESTYTAAAGAESTMRTGDDTAASRSSPSESPPSVLADPPRRFNDPDRPT